MRMRAFAAKFADLDVFLGIVPGAAGIRHHNGEREAGRQRTDQQPQHPGDAEGDPGQHGDADGNQRWGNHLALGCRCADGDAASIVGLLRAFEDARKFQELAAHLFYHSGGGATHRAHSHGGEVKGSGHPGKHAYQHGRVEQRDVIEGHEVLYRHFQHTDGLPVDHQRLDPTQLMQHQAHFFQIGRQQGHRGERSGANGKPFADGGSGVSNCVQLVGPAAHFWFQACHFGIAAGVVGDRPVGVGGQCEPQGGEHANRGKTHAVQPQENIAGPACRIKADGDAQNHRRNRQTA